MTGYDSLTRFYDPIMGDQKDTARSIHKLIKKNHKNCSSLLEIACGTGSFLNYYNNFYDVSGLDISDAILSAAREKNPEIPLYRSDMLTFNFEEKYDCIICLNDSINHLLTLRDWKRLFNNVFVHLENDGIFIFDINTFHKLDNLCDSPPVVHEFGDNILITDVNRSGRNAYRWNLRILEHTGSGKFILHEHNLFERTFTVAEIKKIIKNNFRMIETEDLEHGKVSKNSERIYFVLRKKK